jgi:hypothetical protein
MINMMRHIEVIKSATGLSSDQLREYPAVLGDYPTYPTIIHWHFAAYPANTSF